MLRSESIGGGPSDGSVDGSAAFLGRVSGLTVPRKASGLRFSSRVPGGWIGSYSSVASLPASLRMILEPPGWSGRKSVTYYRLQSQLRIKCAWQETYIIHFSVQNHPTALGRGMVRDCTRVGQLSQQIETREIPSAASNTLLMLSRSIRRVTEELHRGACSRNDKRRNLALNVPRDRRRRGRHFAEDRQLRRVKTIADGSRSVHESRKNAVCRQKKGTGTKEESSRLLARAVSRDCCRDA